MQRIHFSAKGLTVDRLQTRHIILRQSKAETVNKCPVQIYLKMAKAVFLICR